MSDIYLALVMLTTILAVVGVAYWGVLDSLKLPAGSKRVRFQNMYPRRD